MATEIVPPGTTDLTSIGANGNIVVFESGSQAVTGGLDKSGLAEGWAGLFLQPGFAGTIGGGGFGPLRVDVDAGSGMVVNAAGGGALYLHPDGDEDRILILRHVGPASTYLMGGGTVVTLEATAGMVQVSAAVAVTNLHINGGYVRMQSHATAITSAIIGGGRAVVARSVTTARISGGADVAFVRDPAGASLPTATTLTVTGGTLRWQGGNITTAEVIGTGSRLDMRAVSQDITIGTLTGTADELAASGLLVESGGSFRAQGGGLVTVTTVNVLAGARDYKYTPHPI